MIDRLVDYVVSDAPRTRDFRLAALALAVLTVFLFTFRQPVYPGPDFDEGAYVNVAKTFAEDGIYAEKNLDGYNFLGPVISTGPTVILPIALLFKFVDPSIPAARLTIAAYGLLMMASFAILCLRLMRPQAVLLAVLLVLFGWGNQMPYMFRLVIGEGPGLALLFTGLVLWLTERSGPIRLVLTGVLFGLVTITKVQYAFFVLPALLLMWIANMLWYRQRRWDYFVIPGIVSGVIFFGWTYFTYFLNGVGIRDPAADMSTVQAAAGSAYFVLDVTNKVQNVYNLVNGTIHGGLFIPAALYGLWRSRRRTGDGLIWGILTAMLLLSSGFYILSIGWVRLSIATKIMAALFVAAFVFDAFKAVVQATRSTTSRDSDMTPRWIALMLVAGWLIFTVVLPSFRAIYYVVRLGDASAYMVGAYLTENAPPETIVESWEKELSLISDHVYHFPPQLVEAQVNAYEHRLSDTPAGELYDFRDFVDPAYVVIGPLGRKGELYSAEKLADFALVETFGPYEIYARR